MSDPNNAILTVAQMRAAEQALIDAGTSIDALMLRAGRGAAEYVWRMAAGRPVTVVCGPGNNGGDGYVIAETLRARGLAVSVIAAMEPATDAARNARSAWQGPLLAPEERPRGAVFVDCLFGSGLTRALSDDLVRVMSELAATHDHAVAVDLPSNVESDSGRCLGPVPRYNLTIALGAWKWAHFTMPAAERMGALRSVPIGIALPEAAGRVIDRPRLAAPPADSHKYRRGLLAIVAGAMPGAALLAARAAQHGGAGYVKLLAHRAPDGMPASIVHDRRPLAEALADERISAVLCGPGLGRDAAARKLLATVLNRGLPTVLDADALMLLEPSDLPHGLPTILTPHEGEMRKISACFEVGYAENAKLKNASALSARTGATVIAKGPDTVIASAGGAAAAAPPASSWLSTAGTGDVLAGIVASRLAAGAEPHKAACEAVWLHSEAARLAGVAFSADELAGKVAAAYAAAL